MWQRYERVGFSIGMVSSVIVCIAYLLNIFPMPQIDDLMRRCWFILRGELQPMDDIVIVAIDNESIRRLGRFPWRRKLHAQLLRRLRTAKAVVMDMMFVEADKEHPEDDIELANAISGCGNVILPMLRLDEPTAKTKGEEKAFNTAVKKSTYRAPEKCSKSFKERLVAVASRMPLSLKAPVETFIKGSRSVGVAFAYPDTWNIYRHIPLGIPVERSDAHGSTFIVPSVVLEAARVAMGVGKDKVSFVEGGVNFDDKFIQAKGTNWLMEINFVGGKGAFTQFPYHAVLSGDIKSREFDGKVVIVGFTAEGLYDIRPSPFSQHTYGSEILANAIHTIMSGQHFKQIPKGIPMLIALIISALLSLALLRANPLLSLLIMVMVICGITFVTLELFSFRLLLDASPLYGSTILSYALITAWGYFGVGREHRRIKEMFALYVSREVAERLARYPELAALGGEEREISVLFVDIRNFTETMQRLGAKRLVKLLTEYFTEMSDIVKRHGGFVDKFIGDEVMALFGAPLPIEKHALSAVMAALEMRAVTEKLSRQWKERGEPELKVGIGVATGKASVGNFGAVDRFQYTALGDTVNLASRLQAMTKEVGATILVCERTAKEVEGVVELKPVGELKVKGFSEPVKAFEVVGIAQGDDASEAT
jgi:adenylate cyclase